MSAPMAEATRHLILIKHAPPTVVPGVPPSAWTLAEAGRASCATLAQRLARYNIAAIATSDEPKARETAELLATNLGFHDPIIPDHELREHERRAADFYPEQGSFEAAVRDLFARPDEVAFGAETATAVRERFTAAVGRHLAATPIGDLALVAHGTVIALFVAAHTDTAPFALWQRLGLPSFVVLALPGFRLVETVATIDR